jgi:transposase-like protein
MRPRGSEFSVIGKHPERAAIELALARGVRTRKIAKRYGISIDSIYRYRKRLRAEQPEVFRALGAANWRVTPEELEALRLESSDGWLKQLRAQFDKLVVAQDKCLEGGNYTVAAQLASQVHRALEMIGRAVGEIAQHSTTVNNNLIVSPQYWAVRTAIVQALALYPEARRAVLDALRRAEAQSPDGSDNVPLLALAPPAEPRGAVHVA